MPHIRIAEANEQVYQKEGEEDDFDQNKKLAARIPFRLKLMSAKEPQAQACGGNDHKRRANRSPCVRHTKRPAYPRNPRQQRQPHNSTERVGILTQTRQGKACDWVRYQPQQEDESIPNKNPRQRIFVLQPVVVKKLRPCAADPLRLKPRCGQEQIFVVGGFFGQQVNHLG